jgi:hypothetical protein
MGRTAFVNATRPILRARALSFLRADVIYDMMATDFEAGGIGMKARFDARILILLGESGFERTGKEVCLLL